MYMYMLSKVHVVCISISSNLNSVLMVCCRYPTVRQLIQLGHKQTGMAACVLATFCHSVLLSSIDFVKVRARVNKMPAIVFVVRMCASFEQVRYEIETLEPDEDMRKIQEQLKRPDELLANGYSNTESNNTDRPHSTYL